MSLTLFVRRLDASLPFPQFIQAMVDGNPVEPRGKITVRLKLFQLEIRFCKNLLGQILGILFLSNHPVQAGKDFSFILVDKSCIGLLISALHQTNELVIVLHLPSVPPM